MGFFDNLKLKKDGNGNLKVTYKKKPFITLHIERVHEIIEDYATKKFLNRVMRIKEDIPADDETFAEAKKLESIYTAKKRAYYNRPKIANVPDTSREFNYFIEALEIVYDFDTNFATYVDAQVKGLDFANTFPTPNQMVGAGAEKRLLDYTSTKDNNVKTTKEDFERGSPLFLELNKEFKENSVMTVPEMEYLVKYYKINFSQVPRELTDYLKELQGNDRQR